MVISPGGKMMLRSFFALCAIMLAVSSGTATAMEPFKEARFYYTACREAIRVSNGQSGDQSSAFPCIAFLSGISDYNYLLRDAGLKQMFCEPAQNTIYDLMTTYVSFLDSKGPSFLSYSAVSMFTAAMMAKYPCR
jgi:hypothetical protein